MDDGLYVLWSFVDIDNVANVYNYPQYLEVHALLQNNFTQQRSTSCYDIYATGFNLPSTVWYKIPDRAVLLASVCNSIGKVLSYICSTGAVHNFCLSSLKALSASAKQANVLVAPHKLVSGSAIALNL